MFFVFSFSGMMYFYNVDEELKEEKNPERIATILYKKPVITKSISKTPDQKKKIQKTEPKKEVKKPPTKEEPKKVAVEKKPDKPRPVKKPEPKVGTRTSKNTKRARKASPRVAKTEVKKLHKSKKAISSYY